MNFKPSTPERPAREEFISEDENFKLIVDHTSSRYGRYVIITERFPLCPGFGMGQTRREAMVKARESLEQSIVILKERMSQIDKMIEEESQETANEMD